jgi:hypothetical protein
LYAHMNNKRKKNKRWLLLYIGILKENVTSVKAPN